MSVFKNEAVEVKYAGQSIRGYAVEVTPHNVTVEASFGVRIFDRALVTGLRFMRPSVIDNRKQVYEDAMNH